MPKILPLIVFLFSIILFSFIVPLGNIVRAAETCSNSGITYSPNAFPADPSDLTLHFTINNPNTASILNGKYVRLHFSTIVVPFFGDINTEPVLITGNTFQINPLNVTRESYAGSADRLKIGGRHEAVLNWEPDPKKDYIDFCSGISYSVTDSDTCVVDPNLPLVIPPETAININFSGKPNTSYSLVDPATKFSLRDATTDSKGQGSFSNMLIPGTNGDKFVVNITTSDKARIGVSSCTTTPVIKLDAKTSKPPTLTPGSVPLPGPGTAPGTGTTTGAALTCTGSNCTKAGGELCDNNEGIQTAIGCVHTEPQKLIKDIFTLSLGIGGGIAFLLMVWGAFEMITSAGNPDTLKAGKERFMNAIIGILFIVFSSLLLQIIGVDILNIPGFTK